MTARTAYFIGYHLLVVMTSDPTVYNQFGRATACATKSFYSINAVRKVFPVVVNIIPNMIAYALSFVGTTLFLVIFKRSIQVRKSLTAKKKNSDSATETKLMQKVFIVCIIYILTCGPRTIERTISGIISTKIYLTRSRSLYEDNIQIPSYAKYVFLVMQAINDTFNNFVYLAIN